MLGLFSWEPISEIWPSCESIRCGEMDTRRWLYTGLIGHIGVIYGHLCLYRFHGICETMLGPVIFRFKKSNFPFQKKLNSVSIPFHYWQR